MKTKHLLAALLGTVMCSAVPVHAQESYLSVGAGRSEYRADGASENKTALSLAYGQKLGEAWGYELGYVNFGSLEASAEADSFSASGKVRAQSVYVAAVGSLPLSESFSAFGKVGASINYVKYSGTFENADGTYSGSDSETRLGPMVGLGIAYDFSKDIAATLEYRYFHGIADEGVNASALTAGIAYKF